MREASSQVLPLPAHASTTTLRRGSSASIGLLAELVVFILLFHFYTLPRQAGEGKASGGE
jgi:hypothetical protein